MKPLKYLLTLAAVTVALTLSAKADLVFLGAEAFPGDNSPANNLIELQNFTQTLIPPIDTTGFVLCDNIEDLPEDAGDQTITVMDGEFLVVHYGTGKGGSNPGGSLEFFQVQNGETQVTVPGNGNVAGDDPFGHGGISSIRGFCPPGTHVPDSGTTAMLLGSALAGLGLVRRYLKR
jgi:VPDSG-CTERM motif